MIIGKGAESEMQTREGAKESDRRRQVKKLTKELSLRMSNRLMRFPALMKRIRSQDGNHLAGELFMLVN